MRPQFGDEVIDEKGAISRPALSKCVVGEANSDNLKKVTGIVFPLIDAARDEEELARIDNLEDPEVVLLKRPRRLQVEVATGTDRLPLVDGARVYVLRLRRSACA